MNLLQKLGLQKEDEVTKSPPPAVENQTRIAAPLLQTFGNKPTFPSVVSSNTDYNAHLDKALDSANEPGFDFLEFHKTLNGFDGKPLGEQQKYETAFVAAESMGVTAQALVASGQRYLKVLDKEESDFVADMDSASESKITSKNQEIERLRQENEELARRIEENNQKSQALNMEVLDASNVLGGEQKAFEYALNNKRVILTDRITKIQQYLYGTTK